MYFNKQLLQERH